MSDNQIDERIDLDELIGDLAEEFSQRLRDGEKPKLDEYVERYPQAASAIRQIFPALEIMGESPDQNATPAPDDSAFRRGMIGEYRIIQEVGRGGMGVVYEAEQQSLGRRVALKVLPFAAVLDERQIKRFRNEALAAAQLDHPNIVDVYGVGCERSVHFYTMRFVEGEPLSRVIEQLRAGHAKTLVGAPNKTSDPYGETELQREPQAELRNTDSGSQVSSSPQRDTAPLAALSTEGTATGRAFFQNVARIGIEVAEALDHAHQQGVIHRDIKPANIILDRCGKSWITDFGLARMESRVTMTMTGDLLGTVRYMSPEQAMAKRVVVDHRADVYSLGVTLYELMTLQPAFGDEERHELLRKIAFEDPKLPRKLNPRIPPELETIVLKAMAKNPNDRYATAQELADDLNRFVNDEPIRAKRSSLWQQTRKWLRRHPTFSISASVAGAILMISLLTMSLLVASSETNARELAEETAQQQSDLRKKAEEATVRARKNLKLAHDEQKRAEEERRRAEENFELALKSLNDVYLRAVGWQRLFGIKDPLTGEFEGLTEQEKKLLKTGRDFYVEIADQNEDSPTATYQVASAFVQLGHIHANLEDRDAAQSAFDEAISRLKQLTSKYPENPKYFKRLGTAYFSLANSRGWRPDARNVFVEAERALSRAIELDPTDADVHSTRGWTRRALAKGKLALADFRQAVSLDPEDPDKHAWLAGILSYSQAVGVRNRHLAVEHAKKAIELEPQNAHHRASLGRMINLATGDKEKALEQVNKAIELDPSLAWAYCQRAKITREMKRFHQALEDIQRAVDLRPEWVYAIRWRGNVYMELGRYEEAFADFNKVEQLDPNRIWLYLDRGDTYKKLGQYHEAENDYNKAIELYPLSRDAHRRRVILFFHLKDYDKALADIAKFVDLGHTNALRWLSPRQIANCPDLAFRDAILQLTEKTLEVSPKNINVLVFRADFFEALGEDTNANVELSRIIELKPDNATHWNRRGLNYGTRGNEEKAHADYSKAIELDPDNWAFRYNRGIANCKLGQLEQALADLSKAHELNPQSAKVLWARGSLSVQRNEWGKAAGDYQLCLRAKASSSRWYLTSLLQAYTGNVETYAGNCRAMLEQFRDSKDINARVYTAWTASLLPKAMDDFTLAVDLAKRVASEQPDDVNAQETLGAILYRAGQYPVALKQLEKAHSMSLESKSDAVPPVYIAYFLALTHHALGQRSEARNWLKKANSQADKELHGETSPAWNRKLTLRLLQREAESLIGGTSSEPVHRPATAEKAAM